MQKLTEEIIENILILFELIYKMNLTYYSFKISQKMVITSRNFSILIYIRPKNYSYFGLYPNYNFNKAKLIQNNELIKDLISDVENLNIIKSEIDRIYSILEYQILDKI
jgi:hypothetical protein